MLSQFVQVEKVLFATGLPQSVPALFRGTLHVDDVANTYIRLPSWSKGSVWVNGFNMYVFAVV